MPKPETHSIANDSESQDVSGALEPANDQLAIKSACRLIDSYVLTVWREPPPSPSPSPQPDAAASTRSVDPAATPKLGA